MKTVQIRPSQNEDFAELMTLYQNAFADEEASMIQTLVSQLLSDSTEPKLSSWVAVDAKQVVGHVIFSTAHLEGDQNTPTTILAPLAVTPAYQKQGIGSLLVNFGLKTLKQEGIKLCLVYGDPNYYRRFGFVAEHNIHAPYPLQFPHGWLALSLTTQPIANFSGRLKCLAPLMHKHYW